MDQVSLAETNNFPQNKHFFFFLKLKFVTHQIFFGPSWPCAGNHTGLTHILMTCCLRHTLWPGFAAGGSGSWSSLWRRGRTRLQTQLSLGSEPRCRRWFQGDEWSWRRWWWLARKVLSFLASRPPSLQEHQIILFYSGHLAFICLTEDWNLQAATSKLQHLNDCQVFYCVFTKILDYVLTVFSSIVFTRWLFANNRLCHPICQAATTQHAARVTVLYPMMEKWLLNQ